MFSTGRNSLSPPGIVNLQAVVRRARRLDGAQPDEAADPVIDMDDEVAGGKARHLGDEVLRPLRLPARAHQALAQHVLLADERDIVGLEACLDAEHGERDLRPRQSERLRPGSDRREIEEPVLGEHVAHALARALAPQRDDDTLAGRLQPFDVLLHRLEDVAAELAALGDEIPSGMRGDLHRIGGALGSGEWRQAGQRRLLQAVAPFAFAEVEPARRQRLIGRAGAGLIERVLARLIVVGDLRQALVGRLLGEWLDRERRSREEFEQRFQPMVEQRQPMLHAGGAAALAHCLVEHVVGAGGAELRDIAGAEQADGLGRELEFRHGHEVERAQLLGRALGFRIEAADRLQRVAEEIEPHRRRHAGGEQIDDAAAHRIVARLAHGGGAVEAVELEPLRDPRHRQEVSRRRRKRLAGDHLARRHALQDGVDGRERDCRALAPLDAGEARERGHALRHHPRMRRHAVVRQAIPGGKFQHLDVGREEGKRAGERGHALAVAADHSEADRWRRPAGGDGPRQIREHEPFGAVGYAGEEERPASGKALGRRSRG